MRSLTLCLLLTLYISAIASKTVVAHNPTVSVNLDGQGTIVGNYNTSSWTNQRFMQFRGIPFAESPKGNLRFKAPVPKRSWRNPFDATKYGKACPQEYLIAQLTKEELQEDLEDCLNLCVYTKNLNAKRPVMVFLHGGYYSLGTAFYYPPNYLMEKDVVYVIPQYRLGVLGFYGTLTDNMPGNVAVMDLILSLQWIKKHISKFGGDPENVTLFGESAGAALIGALMISPKTPDNLFHRVITQSDSILDPFGVREKNPPEQVRRACQALKCKKCTTDDEMYQCLKEASVTELLAATATESFSSVVGDALGIMPQHPSVLLDNYNKVIPMMTGFTKHEGSIVLATHYYTMKEKYNKLSSLTVREFATSIMDYLNDTTGLTNNLFNKMFFTKDLLDSHDHKRAIPNYFDLAGVAFLKSPTITYAWRLLRKKLAPIYLYTYDYEGSSTLFGFDLGNAHYPFNGGVHHGDEMIYLFPMRPLNRADIKVAKETVELWTSFACQGIPKPIRGPPVLPMKTEDGPYFHIDKEITMDDDVLNEMTVAINDPNKTRFDRKHIEF